MIPATMREKERYIGFELVCDNLLEKEAREGVTGALVKFLGELGYAAAHPKIIEYNAAERRGILRTTSGELENVKSALVLANSIAGRPARIKLLRVSGTIKKLKEKSAR